MTTTSSAAEFDLTHPQKVALAILPRICACISVLCISYMAWTILCSPYNRKRIYHRIMLGCTPSILLLNAAQLWGQAAAPEGTAPHVIGARGNTATCTAQGFLYQFRVVVPSYYFVLALLTRRRLIRGGRGGGGNNNNNNINNNNKRGNGIKNTSNSQQQQQPQQQQPPQKSLENNQGQHHPAKHQHVITNRSSFSEEENSLNEFNHDNNTMENINTLASDGDAPITEVPQPQIQCRPTRESSSQQQQQQSSPPQKNASKTPTTAATTTTTATTTTATTTRQLRNSYLHSSQEILIHIGVYICPLASGFYLMSVQGLNMISQGCGIASIPLGCGDQSPPDDFIPCERGPDNIGQLQWLLAGMPGGICMSGATLLMASTYFQMVICNFQDNKEVASSLAKQSALYLLALYWTYVFRWLDAALILKRGEFVFATSLLAEMIDPLQGLWTLLVYQYFRSMKQTKNGNEEDHHHHHLSRKNKNSTKTVGTSTMIGDSVILTMANGNGNGSGFSGIDGSGRGSTHSHHSSAGSTPSFLRRPSFSIFDGSNVADIDSPWAAFLQDEGEDEEYRSNFFEYTDDYYQLQERGQRLQATHITTNSTQHDSSVVIHHHPHQQQQQPQENKEEEVVVVRGGPRWGSSTSGEKACKTGSLTVDESKSTVASVPYDDYDFEDGVGVVGGDETPGEEENEDDDEEEEVVIHA